MALFDDEDESDDTTGSGSWGVDEDREPPSTEDDGDDADPLADLDAATIADDAPHGTLKRAVDPEAGVVIYAYKNGNAGGLSTVPLAETDLAAEDGA